MMKLSSKTTHTLKMSTHDVNAIHDDIMFVLAARTEQTAFRTLRALKDLQNVLGELRHGGA